MHRFRTRVVSLILALSVIFGGGLEVFASEPTPHKSVTVRHGHDSISSGFTPSTFGSGKIDTAPVTFVERGGLSSVSYSLHPGDAVDGDYTGEELVDDAEKRALLGAILTTSHELGGIKDSTVATGSVTSDRWLVTQVLVWSLMGGDGNIYFEQTGKIGVSGAVKKDVERAIEVANGASSRAEDISGLDGYLDQFYGMLRDFYAIPSFAMYTENGPVGNAWADRPASMDGDGVIMLTGVCKHDDGMYYFMEKDTNGVMSRFDFSNQFKPNASVEQDNLNNTLAVTYAGGDGYYEYGDEVMATLPGGPESFECFKSGDNSIVSYVDSEFEMGCRVGLEVSPQDMLGMAKAAPGARVSGLQENEQGKISYEGLCEWLKDKSSSITEWSMDPNNSTSVLTRERVVEWLESHKDWYLNTVYKGGDYQSPNGDWSYNGSPGMNCAGFVAHVMRSLGMNCDTFSDTLTPILYRVLHGSGLKWDLAAGASNWISMAHFHKWNTYVFRTKEELLASGVARKGDIVVSYWSLQPGHTGHDNHIGFFWGDTPSDDKFWHSSTHPQKNGNAITGLEPKSNGSLWVLIPLDSTTMSRPTPTLELKTDPPRTPEVPPGVFIRKKSDDGKIEGITFTITGDGKTYTKVTNEYGIIDCSDLPVYFEGTKQFITYHVEEEIPVRYIHDQENASKNFILEPGKTVFLDFENKQKMWRLTFKKHDSILGDQAQGRGTLFGAEFGIYHNGELIDVVMSNYDGLVVTDYYPCDTGYTLKELLAPDGYKLNPTVYAIGLNPGETLEQFNDCNRLEPLDDGDPDVIRTKYEIQGQLDNEDAV